MEDIYLQCKFSERLDEISPMIRDLIESYEDVRDDGHSAFRAIAKQLGFNVDDGWKDVKKAILEELRRYANEYIRFFSGEEEFKNCEVALQCEEPTTREDKWIKHQGMGLVIACAFHCVFVIVNSWPYPSISYLPLRQPSNPTDNRIVVICNVDEKKHYLKLKFMDDAPLPPIAACWKQSKYPEAIGWEDLYRTKFEEWDQRVKIIHQLDD